MEMMMKKPEALRLADELAVFATWRDDSTGTLGKSAAELRRLYAIEEANEAMLEALKDAATSLETIGRLAGKANYIDEDGERIPTFMQHNDEVRGYAKSRATVARAAIAKGEQA